MFVIKIKGGWQSREFIYFFIHFKIKTNETNNEQRLAVLVFH